MDALAEAKYKLDRYHEQGIEGDISNIKEALYTIIEFLRMKEDTKLWLNG
jgi:hypothetical protein